MKNIIKQYNQSETLLTITSYPNTAKNKKFDNFNAVGWHSKKTLTQLSETRKVIVLAEHCHAHPIVIPGSDPGSRKTYIDSRLRGNDNLLVYRVWQKGNPISFIPLFFFIRSLPKVKNIYIQFEFNVFGGILPNLALLLLLVFLRLSGKKITFELHQVITDIKALVKHIHIKNFLIQKFFNLGLKVFYILLSFVVNQIIVFEEELKNRLPSIISRKKIHVLSLSADKKMSSPQNLAKKSVGLKSREFVIMVFGFINGYKGVDWIIDCMNELKEKNIKLVIAGGENPYLKDKPFYQRFYRSIIENIKKNDSIIHTGFVPHYKVTNYFNAADLVVLPYTVFMSASGPFSLAISHSRPVILSDKLYDYTKSHDLAVTMKSLNLEKKDLFFKLNKTDFAQMLTRMQSDKNYYEKLTLFSHNLSYLRSSKNIIKKLDNIIFYPGINMSLRAEGTAYSPAKREIPLLTGLLHPRFRSGSQ